MSQRAGRYADTVYQLLDFYKDESDVHIRRWLYIMEIQTPQKKIVPQGIDIESVFGKLSRRKDRRSY
jgi:hypothetical protein